MKLVNAAISELLTYGNVDMSTKTLRFQQKKVEGHSAHSAVTAIDGTPLEYVEKKKVVNQTGQEVIVMGSKWFKKIINDNDIPVRGFFRMQNKKNAEGEWYKELIFVDPYIRHGYHRNAIIEDSESVE